MKKYKTTKLNRLNLDYTKKTSNNVNKIGV